MRLKMSRCLLLAALVAISAEVRTAHCQAVPPDQAARAVSTVMHYRQGWMDDPLPFDPCSVRRALGGTEDFASMIAPQVRSMLGEAEASCPPAPALNPRRVFVDSVQSAEPAVLVYVTVLHGELIHHETHELNPHAWTPFMGVRSVRLWGNGQFYPVRPGRGDDKPER